MDSPVTILLPRTCLHRQSQPWHPSLAEDTGVFFKMPADQFLFAAARYESETTVSSMPGWNFASSLRHALPGAIVVSSRNVSSATKRGIILQPRFIIIHAATGRVNTPETSATSVPSTPRGRPPTAFSPYRKDTLHSPGSRYGSPCPDVQGSL